MESFKARRHDLHVMRVEKGPKNACFYVKMRFFEFLAALQEERISVFSIFIFFTQKYTKTVGFECEQSGKKIVARNFGTPLE